MDRAAPATGSPATSFAIVSRSARNFARSSVVQGRRLDVEAAQRRPGSDGVVRPGARECGVAQQVGAVFTDADGVEEILDQAQAAGRRRELVPV